MLPVALHGANLRDLELGLSGDDRKDGMRGVARQPQVVQSLPGRDALLRRAIHRTLFGHRKLAAFTRFELGTLESSAVIEYRFVVRHAYSAATGTALTRMCAVMRQASREAAARARSPSQATSTLRVRNFFALPSASSAT